MTRNDIIRAAFKVWGREFYQTMSLTGVAKELGVSKAALYRHFKDKEALLDMMNTVFFDEYTAFIKSDYEKALASGNLKESCHIMLRIVSEYYGRNKDIFIFFLFHVFDSLQIEKISAQMVSRGIDFDAICQKAPYSPDPVSFHLIIQFIMPSLSFLIIQFHHYDHKQKKAPTDEEIRMLVAYVEDRICRGLDLSAKEVNSLDYFSLEKKASAAIPQYTEDNQLLRAVAVAVADAGPWNVSMGMVARRSGLAKSSLYAHFKSKQDMLGRLFITEFARIAAYAGKNIKMSNVPAEQLYLVLSSIDVYLRSRPEILIAMDWFRTRRPELNQKMASEKRRILPELYRIITDIDMPALKEAGDKKDRFAQWILFLTVKSILSWSDLDHSIVSDWGCLDKVGASPEKLRMLYRFIALGLKGFNL